MEEPTEEQKEEARQKLNKIFMEIGLNLAPLMLYLQQPRNSKLTALKIEYTKHNLFALENYFKENNPNFKEELKTAKELLDKCDIKKAEIGFTESGEAIFKGDLS